MRAFTLDAFDAQPRLRDDLSEPRPGPNELVVRVQASSVNPVDTAIAAGLLKEMVEHTFPVTLGRDFAGVVDETGADVSLYRAGDEVFGYVLHADPEVRDGSWSELISVPEHNEVAPRPVDVETAQAGAAPLAGVTALLAFDALAPAAGEKVLVIGATGGVGSFFVQLAANGGADVIAPALPEDHDYLHVLGVTEILDRSADLESTMRERYPDGVDAVIDLVSFTPQEALLAERTRLASTLGAAGEGPRRFNVVAQPTPENLRRVGGLLENGTLQVHIQRTFPLEDAGKALEALPAGHTQGKLALTIP